ncbi:MAG: relaxase domain-containing protein [Acidobacteriota bacterium]|nr:relaxase domain-containing protein [Acidobacteriota bacterium]
MLTISKPLSAGQARSYHEKEFANAEQNYYSQKGASQGEWTGKLAAELGLEGTVAPTEFARLAEGQHPATGKQMVEHRVSRNYTNEHGETITTAEHRAGWDATFSAPKSVSITALVGGDEQVREAHRESVAVALTELERYIQARIGGNHPAETTGKMIAAKFEHDSARPVNGYAAPQLHTHVVIFNVSQTADGETHALQPHELYKSQQYATAIYRSELARRLRELGYELEPAKNGAFEIKGYTPEYLQASSPRRQQIKQYLEANGLAGAEAAEIGAHRTRETKINLTLHEMRWINLALAAAHGNDPRIVVSEVRERRQQHQQAPAEERFAERLRTAHAALTYARDRNIEREAVVDERVLLRDALKRSLGEASLNDIQRALNSRIRSGEFVEARHESGSQPGRWFTTAQMIAYERENLSTMTSGRNQKSPLVRPERMSKLHNDIERLNPSQRRVVIEILQSEDKITGLQGTAGTGKTTALAAIRRAAQREGYEVQGFAPTSRAARQLEEAGITSSTLQRFLVAGQEEMKERPHLYMLDESSLASTKQVNQFFKRLRERDRVLLVGDIRQHQAVEAGRPFEQMQEAGMRTARLEETVRQQDLELKEAVELLAQGKAKEAKAAVDRLNSQGRVHEVRDSGERLKAIVQEYLKEPEKSLIVSPDNRSRSEINRLAHESLQAAGKVSGHEHRVTVLVNRQELTGADRQWAASYEPDDVIRYTRGSKQAGIKAGEYATVLRADIGPNTITVRRENNEQVTYDPRRLQGVNVYKEEERHFAEGDRVQFTAPFKDQRVANRELSYIEKIDANGDLTLRLESGGRIEFNLQDHPHLDYGYAMTSYSSQGQTADRVIVHAPMNEREQPDLINQRFAYVALSRAKYDAQIYTNDASSLGENLSREVSKRVAIEIQPVRGQERSRQGPEQKKEAALEQTIA